MSRIRSRSSNFKGHLHGFCKDQHLLGTTMEFQDVRDNPMGFHGRTDIQDTPGLNFHGFHAYFLDIWSFFLHISRFSTVRLLSAAAVAAHFGLALRESMESMEFATLLEVPWKP